MSSQNMLKIDGLPHWIFWMRIAQAVVAVIFLALTAFAASVLGPGALLSTLVTAVPGFGLGWFTFAWTVLFLGYAIFGVQRTPAKSKPLIILLVLELLTVLWWLVTFALLAKTATDYSYLTDSVSSFDSSGSTSGYGYGSSGTSPYYTSTKVKRDSFTDEENKLIAALNTTKAAAGIGALEFALFVGTVAIVIRAVIRSDKTQKNNFQEPMPQHQGQTEEHMQTKTEVA